MIHHETAETIFKKLDGQRQAVLQRARDAAELTIPSLMPPEGHTENDILADPKQSLGSRGVNNLAAKLLLSLLPPNVPFYRFEIDEEVLEELGTDGADTAVRKGMQKLENKLQKRIEGSSLRLSASLLFKYLVVTGNALLYRPKGLESKTYRLDQFVIQRDLSGDWVLLILKDTVSPTTLDESTKEACDVVSDGDDAPKQVSVFTIARRVNQKIEYHKQINGKMVPNSEGKSGLTESPFMPLRWNAIPGENYGRGHIEEHIGDLRSYEVLSKDMLGYAAAASKIVFLLKPESPMEPEDLTEAESGDFVMGDPEDVAALQVEKFSDFRVTKEVMDDISLRLAHAFLLQSGTVRDAERVTAEEIKAMAEELEDVLGGVYTILSREFQFPLVLREMSLMKEDKELPPFPKIKGKDAVSPTIVTGFDALGRGRELSRLRDFLADLGAVKPDALALLDNNKIIETLGVGHNVEVSSLIKSPEQINQEQQQQMASQLIDKAAAPVAGAVAGSITQPNKG